MKIFTSLRQVNQAQIAARLLYANLKQLGCKSVLKSLEPGLRYLKMRGSFLHGGCYDVLLDISSWGQQCYPEWGIDWQKVDIHLLQDFLRERFQVATTQIGIDTEVLTLESIGCIASGAQHSGLFPCLSTTQGQLFFFQMHTVAGGTGWMKEVSGLTVQVQASLGKTRLAWRVLRRIRLGDILLIEQPEMTVWCHEYPLFSFALEKEGLVMNEHNKTLQEKKGQDAAGQHFLLGNDKLSQVRVEVQFVLMERKLSLIQLQSMVAGEVWAMPQDTEKNISLKVNNILFAEGELVQLSDGRLGIEVQKMIKE